MRTQLTVYRPNLITDPYFTDSDSSDWTAGSGWTIETGYAQATNAFNVIFQSCLVVGKEYTGKFFVSNLSGGTINVFLGSTTVYTGSSNGWVTFSGQCASSGVFQVLGIGLTARVSKFHLTESPNAYNLDLSEDLDFPLTFAIADIRDPSTRGGTFSKTVKLIGTKTNNKVFTELFEISGIGTYNPNKKVRAIVEQDGVVILDGYIQVVNIVRNNNGPDSYDLIDYETVLYGKVSNIFIDMADSKLSDLNLSEYTHTYTKQNIKDSWKDSIVKNSLAYTNWSNGSLQTFTSTQYAISPVDGGGKVQLNFIGPHGFVVGDQVYVTLANATVNQHYQGDKIVDYVPSSTSVIIDCEFGITQSGETGNAYTHVPFGEGYVYPLIDYGHNGAGMQAGVLNMYPAVYAKTYLDKIFAKYGYQYNSDFFNSSLFKRLIVPYNGDGKLSLTQDEMILYSLKAELTVSESGTLPLTYNSSNARWYASNTGLMPVLFDNDSTNGNSDPSNAYDTAIGKWTCPATGSYNILYKVRKEFTLSPPAGNTFAQAGGSSFITLRVDINGNALSGGVITDINLQFSGGYYNVVSYSGIFQAGDELEFFIQFTPTSWTFQNGNTPITTGTASMDWAYDTGQLIITANPTIVEGSTLPLSRVIPDMFCKDFFSGLIKAFDLYVDPDKDNEKLLNIEPRDDFYASGTTQVWTDKLDISRPLEIKPMADLQGRKYILQYKEDKDVFNQDHIDKYKESGVNLRYGAEIIVVDNDFAQNTVSIDNTFSSTVLIDWPNNFPTPSSNATNYPVVLSAILGKDNNNNPQPIASNPRLLYFAVLGTDQSYWTVATNSPFYNGSNAGIQPGWDFIQTNCPTFPAQTYPCELLTIYPYAGHLNDPWAPRTDLNYGYPGGIYYNYRSWTSDNLYNHYWKKYLDEITLPDSKIITGYFRLTAKDIRNLDFRDTYYVDGHVLRLNKITDYSAVKEETVLCEFIKAQTNNTYVPVKGRDLVIGNGTSLDGTALPVADLSRPTSTSNVGTGVGIQVLGVGNYVGNGSRDVLIEGDSNRVGSGSSNITILGSNGVTIAGGLSNVTVINTNNITVTSPNVTWINGMQVVEGGGIISGVNIVDAGVDTVLNPFNPVKNINLVDGGKDAVRNLGGFSIEMLIDGGKDAVSGS